MVRSGVPGQQCNLRVLEIALYLSRGERMPTQGYLKGASLCQ